MIWLTTRPLSRTWIYLAKYLGAIPWTVGFAFLGFALLCLAGGELGLRAAKLYWQPVLASALAFGSLFFMMGTMFNRPAVVGLVYIFFYETLVGNLPGSLKQLSLNYYVRSLFYHQTTAEIPSVVPDTLEVYEPTDPETAWLILLLVSLLSVAVGIMSFLRQEPREES